MRASNLSKWSDTQELSNLLIFAQALNELLFDHTVDSYKATALNVHSNVMELRFLAEQLMRDRVESGTLIPIIEELEDKIKNDPVTSSPDGEAFKIYVERLEPARKRPNDLFDIASALEIELDELYWTRIREQLQEAIYKPKNNKEILALANVFISEAELQHYSRSFIYHTADRFFFRPESEPKSIDSLDQIAPFLDFFNKQSPSKYKAILRGSRAFHEMTSFAKEFGVEVTDQRPYGPSTSFKVNSFLGESTEFPVFLVIDALEHKDPLSARDFVQQYIETVSSVYCFHSHQQEPSWSGSCIIVDEDDYASVLNPAVSPMKRGTEDEISEQFDVFKTVEIIQDEYFTPESSHVFLTALDYHRAALEAETAENQLIDLWAALEGFSPPPSKEEARITHYVGTLLSSLNLTYPEKIFRYAAKSLRNAGPDVRKIIEGVPIEGDFFTKVVCLIVSGELEETRKKLYAALSNHPLLRFRCFTLHEQFSSTKHIRETIVAHKKRVEWHIQRIYATRNQIVHSAQSLPYLSTLVENLHSYLDTLLVTIMTVAMKSDIRVSVAGALKLLSVQEQSYLRELENSNEKCTCANFKELVFGRQNPVSPFRESLSL